MEVLILSLLEKTVSGVDTGRFLESLVLLLIAWWRVKGSVGSHMKTIESQLTEVAAELKGVSESVKSGFAAGEKRFEQLESRLTVLETKKGA